MIRGEEKQVTEVTFEVTVRHYVTESSPNPTEEDVREGVLYQLTEPQPTARFDVESVTVKRI